MSQQNSPSALVRVGPVVAGANIAGGRRSKASAADIVEHTTVSSARPLASSVHSSLALNAVSWRCYSVRERAVNIHVVHWPKALTQLHRGHPSVGSDTANRSYSCIGADNHSRRKQRAEACVLLPVRLRAARPR